jgi:hypothetical protein
LSIPNSKLSMLIGGPLSSDFRSAYISYNRV